MKRSQNDLDPELPALLGGKPVRPEGPHEWPLRDPAVERALAQAFADGSWGKYHGGHVDRLCAALCELQQVEHALPCASGTAAVELALRGLKVGPGDEVILAAYDFKGNFQDIAILGATPVLVDIDPITGNLDLEQLGGAIGPATRAIITSHLHGGMVPMRELMQLGTARGLPVLEDACQCPGAWIEGRRAGSWGDVGVLSFGGSKLLTAGRGGAVFTNNSGIAQRMRLYTARGNEAYPLSELQAAVLLPQIEKLDQANAVRAERVATLVAQLPTGLVPFRNPDLDASPGYYKLGLWYDLEAWSGLSRDRFSAAMRAEGIAIDPGFRALHRIHSARRYRAVGELPQASRADADLLVLHHPVLLGGPTDIEQIVTALTKVQRYADALREAGPM
ncbi:MAG TPA: DegT/DnrJ/EryC1/StrS family aminotransferase [Planctomycetaceae bacterium]|nr:DegT/DnrJ/EryC1/StrS family aminotransferase [Planctomycetaceae bacterium]